MIREECSCLFIEQTASYSGSYAKKSIFLIHNSVIVVLFGIVILILHITNGRRRNLLDDLKERRGYSHLKEEALDRTMWRARFGRGFGPVVRQTTK